MRKVERLKAVALEKIRRNQGVSPMEAAACVELPYSTVKRWLKESRIGCYSYYPGEHRGQYLIWPKGVQELAEMANKGR